MDIVPLHPTMLANTATTGDRIHRATPSQPAMQAHTVKSNGAAASPQLAVKESLTPTNDGGACSTVTNNDTVHTATNSDVGPQTYPGGKGNVYQRLINQMPPHRVYIEAFAGGGAVLRNKRPAPANIAIDSDAAAVEQLRSDIATNDGNTWLFHHGDALQFLSQYSFTGDELVYADPPYLMQTRRQHRRLYRCELATVAEHAALLDVLTVLPCKVMISGYWSKLYADRLSQWRTISFEAVTRGGAMATEWVWMNYPAPTKLHDYSYLGDDYRERERIKRKTDRWVARLAGLPILERNAILEALGEIS